MRFETHDPKHAKIAALVLEGCDDVEIMQAIRVSLGYVRQVRRKMKAEGRFAGRNVG